MKVDHGASPVPWGSYACLAASMALVGSYVGLSKLLVAAFPVFLLAWMRFGIAAVAMGTWLRPAPGEPAIDRRTAWLLFVESFLGNFMFSICMLYGMRLTSAVAAGVIMAALPAAVAVLSLVALRERIETRVAVSIALAVAGIGLVSATRSDAGAANADAWLGNLLLVAALFCEASYVVIGKRLTASLSPKRISAIVNLWGLVLVTPLGIWQTMSFDFTNVATPTWVLLLFYALAASVWTVWLWMTGLRNVPAARAGVFTIMLPISAALVGVVVLGERLSALQVAAYGLALLGLVLATWPTTASKSNQAESAGSVSLRPPDPG